MYVNYINEQRKLEPCFIVYPDINFFKGPTKEKQN